MGAWGTGVFDNDAAMDWCGSFVDAPDGEGSEDEPGKDTLVAGPLMLIAEEEEDDADIAGEALAAAEVVAAAAGRPSPSLKEADDETLSDIAAWVRKASPAVKHAEMRKLAARAVDRILKDSELADLWEESDDAAAWRKVVEDLSKRLKG